MTLLRMHARFLSPVPGAAMARKRTKRETRPKRLIPNARTWNSESKARAINPMGTYRDLIRRNSIDRNSVRGAGVRACTTLCTCQRGARHAPPYPTPHHAPAVYCSVGGRPSLDALHVVLGSAGSACARARARSMPVPVVIGEPVPVPLDVAC